MKNNPFDNPNSTNSIQKMIRSALILLLLLACTSFDKLEANDPLPSWNNGASKSKILDFLRAVTQNGSPDFVPVKDRIAVFDQDGTLWVEQPVYSEVVFAFDYAKTHSADEEWVRQQPFKAIFEGDLEAAKNLTVKDTRELMVNTHTGMTITAFHESVQKWIEQAIHPRFKRKYTELTYKPMLELINLFKQHQFQVYIVTGSGQEYTRTFSEKTYGIDASHVVGSAADTKYEIIDGRPVLVKEPKLILLNDKRGKPEAINLIIGKLPIAAFGNSIGDRQMLEWTQSYPGKTLEMLVHHDDGVREYAYGPDSKVGTFSDNLMKEAESRGWGVISMKNDWNTIFSFSEEPKAVPHPYECQPANAL